MWLEPGALRGKRALVYSLGMEGRDLAQWLVARGATVTMSDTRTAAQLEAAGAAAPPGVSEVVVGKPLLEAREFDLLAVSQSILRHDPAVVAARTAGVPMTSQMALFLQLCPGRVVGITGSRGKSTTTALVGRRAEAAGIGHVVGGNIGEALLARLEEIRPSATVILEISHTQLQYTDRSPSVGAVTNVTPNHLDQFSWDEYVGLKRHLLAFQGREDVAVMNADDPASVAVMGDARGRLARPSLAGEAEGDGGWLENGSVVLRSGGRARAVLHRREVRLRGEHNLANVVMACAVGAAMGWPDESLRAAVSRFTGVPHRLEVVGRAGGVTWVNDSIATSPERTIAGLRAFADPVVLLLGGREKNLPLEGLAALARERCRAVVCFGAAGRLFSEAMTGVEVLVVEGLSEAVCGAAKRARPGDVVLLSPAGTSFDAYPNFEARGEAFRALVRALPGFEAAVQP